MAIKNLRARDFRHIAWSALGESGWFVSIIGYAFNILVLILAVVALCAGAVAIWDVCKMDAVVHFSKTAGITLERIEDIRTYKRVCAAMGGIAIITLPFFYFIAVLRYGLTAMAVAVRRHGGHFGHALSGYGKGWRLTWLMSLAWLYEFFWSLLLIVPGIRAAYSYRMVFFLSVDRPELPAEKLIDESKRLMDGRRWALFCLDVSFIGWYLLSFFTRNFADIFVKPYHATAVAAFYEDLLDRDEAGEQDADHLEN